MNAKVEHTKGCASRLRYGPHDFCACDCGASSTAGDAVALREKFIAFAYDDFTRGKMNGVDEREAFAIAVRFVLTCLTPWPSASSTELHEAWDEERALPGLADLLPPEPPSASSTAGEAVDWKARAEHYQREHAKLYDQLHGTPCEQMRAAGKVVGAADVSRAAILTEPMPVGARLYAAPEPLLILPFDEHVQNILGRPCFTFIHMSELLRQTGQKIERRAEAEQAACMYYLLGFYLRHGAEWQAHAQKDIDARIKQVKEQKK